MAAVGCMAIVVPSSDRSDRDFSDVAEADTAWLAEDCVWGYEWVLSEPDTAPRPEADVRDDCVEAVELVEEIT